jgi:hypothetical protein
MSQLLWIPGVLAALGLLLWISLPDTVEYRFGDEMALTGDADRGEWVDGWYWSRRAAAEFARRRLGPGVDVDCMGRGDHVRAVVGENRLFRQLACTARFGGSAARPSRATVRVGNRNLATVLCPSCPADPAQRGELLSLADRFVELTHRALPYYNENGRAPPGDVARAERLQLVLERWSGRNAEDAAYGELAKAAAECAGDLVAVISAVADDPATAARYNDCIQRFGRLHGRLLNAWGPRLPT